MLDKVKTFLHANKGKIVLGVTFLVGGLAAVGVHLPQPVVDIVTSVVGGF